MMAEIKCYVIASLFLLVNVYGVTNNLFHIRGGAAAPIVTGGGEYYDQFDLDYGKADNARIAGSMRGFLQTGKLTSLEEKDSFLKWLNNHLETGPEPLEARTKPFSAIDFGTNEDLNPGEYPKIMIVTRKLQAKNGILSSPSDDIDIEERTIWQPWLRSRCNFVVRYIVPDRVNIIKIMEAKNRFNSQLIVEEKNEKVITKSGKSSLLLTKSAHVKMTFRPRLIERFRGKRDIVINKPLNTEELFGASVPVKLTNNNNMVNTAKQKISEIFGKFGLKNIKK